MRTPAVDARAAALLPLQPRDYLILLALVDGALHGHGLLKAVEAQAGGVLFDPANLYRLLRKLERDALVAEVPAGPRDHTRRRQYTLTTLGRSVLVAESGRLAQLADSDEPRRPGRLRDGRIDPGRRRAHRHVHPRAQGARRRSGGHSQG